MSEAKMLSAEKLEHCLTGITVMVNPYNDARKRHEEHNKLFLRRIRNHIDAQAAEIERLRGALGEFIRATDDIWAANDAVGNDTPTYNQMHRIIMATDAIMTMGLDPDALRTARTGQEGE